jgi:GT2 family glycosyltransferase
LRHKVVWICVFYGSLEPLFELFSNLGKQNSGEDVLICVVDNNESYAEDEKFRNFKFENSLELKILRPNQNLGYFGAARFAFEQLNLVKNLPEWTIVSNVDLQVLDSDFLEKLKAQKLDSAVGVLAPRIISALDNTEQNPYMLSRPTKKHMNFLKKIFSNDLTAMFYQVASHYKKTIFCSRKALKLLSSQQNIYAAHGSFLIFTRSYFAKGANLEHEPFLFGEEITVAENLRKHGLKAFFEPQLVVHHNEHETTGLIPNKKMRGFIADASRFCAEKYFSN